MGIETQIINRLVKAEDLNHHGTLYAGRTAEWFVEAGFIAAAKLTNPINIVCLKIHGMQFNKPINKGDILTLQSKIVYAGKTSLIAFIEAKQNQKSLLSGFITFVHVDKDGKSLPHNIQISPQSEEDIKLHDQAAQLRMSK